MRTAPAGISTSPDMKPSEGRKLVIEAKRERKGFCGAAMK
jgi:hypothetical protein